MSYFEQTKLTDSTGVVVNPATEESVLLLRRMVKLLESNAVVDIQNRQRIVVEGMLGTIGNAIGTVRIEQSGGMGALFLVDQRYQIMDAARLGYNNGIRSHLTFS